MPQTLLTLALLATILPSLQAQTPDTILIHGNILTGAHLRPDDPSPTPPRVSAIAIGNGRILAAGSDADILKLQSPATRILDLKGAFALPGFNDAHTHMAAAGQQKLAIDLDHVATLAAMLQNIQRYAAAKPAGSWLQGGGWDQTLWPGKQLPTRQDLDRVTGDRPAFLWRTDGHMALANTAALAAAHITPATPDPPGAKIDRDPTGAPTGILREAAATSLVTSVLPKPSLTERRAALETAIADALAHGVTSVQDFSEWEDFLVLESLENKGLLKLRFSEWLDFNLPLAVLETRRASHPKDDPLLHLGMLKAFMDGSLGSRTAALAAPYADDPANSGVLRYDAKNPAKLNTQAIATTAAGFQLGFHAIGDLANHIALITFANARPGAVPANQPPPPHHSLPEGDTGLATPVTKNPADLRLRIEHAQVLLPEDFQMFQTYGVIASMQPSHLLTDMAWAADRLGPERARYAYAWRSFLEHKVTLAFGTDYPVESIDPMRGLYAAITRQNEAGTQTFHPEQTITLNQALYAYTQASAFADFSEHFRGRLEPGYFADIVLLDHDLTTAAPRQILTTQVLRTIVNGQSVYVAP